MDERDENFQDNGGPHRKCVLSDGLIVLDGHYEIPLHRCDTHAKILGWLCHLCDKRWFDTDMTKRFIRLACEHNGLEIDHHA
jgi:hypothetical protein